MSQAGAGQLDKWDKQLLALNKTLQTLREETNIDNLVNATLDFLRENFDYRLMWIGLYDRANHRIIGKGGITPAGDIKFLKERIALSAGDLLDQVIIQRKIACVPDLRAEVRSGPWQQLAQKLDLQGTVLYPICTRELAYGVVMMCSHVWNINPKLEERLRMAIVLGTLATSLARIEADWEKQNLKRPEQPFLALLEKMRSLPNLGQRLEEIVQEVHKFIVPARTNIYWFDKEHLYFWRRATNKVKGNTFKPDSSTGITVQSAHNLYQALLKDQLVMVADLKTMSKAELTPRNMEQLGAVSVLIAPILFQNQLIGFLDVENDEPRLWTEEERAFVRAMAQLTALIAPLDELESTLERITNDHALMSGIARAIYTQTDWEDAMKYAAEQLCQRLSVERFWVALYNREVRNYQVFYQHYPRNRRALANVFDALSQTDQRMMEQAQEAIAVENLEGDFKFLAWRPALLDMEVRSLVVSSTSIGRGLEGILAVGHEAPRSWTQTEREMVLAVAQQVGMIIHQSEMQRIAEESQRLQQLVHRGLVQLQQAETIDNLQQRAVQLIAEAIQAPLVVLVTWLPGYQTGQISASFALNDDFRLSGSDQVAEVASDPLIQWALRTEGLLPIAGADISPATRAWLNPKILGTVLAGALRTTPDHYPTGILIVGDRQGRQWLQAQTQAVTILLNQLAWSRRHLLLVEHLRLHRQELERLNWYKHRRIEDIYRTVGSGVQRLLEVDGRTGGTEVLTNVRVQQSLRQLQASLSPLPQLVRKEQWRLRPNYETAPLAGILKRAKERVDSLLNQRELWFQVQDQKPPILGTATIGGDIAKIEMIIHELLLYACGRSQVKGRVDVWCRQLDDKFVEVSITDYGTVDPLLLRELQEGRSPDLLAPSLLDQPPGLHLAICQGIMQEAGGDMALYQLEDNRILSRLVLPLATA
ncbi:MAG: GAF domain-containing protein [Pseudanabaenaceae cyanobacterium]